MVVVGAGVVVVACVVAAGVVGVVGGGVYVTTIWKLSQALD